MGKHEPKLIFRSFYLPLRHFDFLFSQFFLFGHFGLSLSKVIFFLEMKHFGHFLTDKNTLVRNSIVF